VVKQFIENGNTDVKKDKWTSKSPLIKEQGLTVYVDDEYQQYLKNDNFKIKNDNFKIKNDNFKIKNDNFKIKELYWK